MSSAEAKSIRWDKIMLPSPGEPQCQLLPVTASWWYCAKLKEQKDISVLSTTVLISHKTYTCYQGTSHPQSSTMCPSKSCPPRFIFSNHFLCSTCITRNLTGMFLLATQVSVFCVIFYDVLFITITIIDSNSRSECFSWFEVALCIFSSFQK